MHPENRNPPEALPLVSIVTPSLNQGRYIEDTLKSVLAQDYPRLEHLVADGGSTDGTLEVLRRYEGRLRWTSGPDAGQAAAINAGFDRTSGEILGWLNADDTYEPQAVSTAVRYLMDHPDTAMVYGEARSMSAEGSDLGPLTHVRPFDLQRLVHESDFIVQPAAFFRRESFEAAGRLDESLHWALDYDLWIRIGRRFPVAHLPQTLARCRQTGENKTAVGGLERFAEIERVGVKHGAGGLPSGFRVDKFSFCLKEAARLVRRGALASAVAIAARGTGSLLRSPRALRTLLSLSMSQLARGRQ